MRSSVLILAALALTLTKASANTGVVNGAQMITLGSAKRDKTQPEAQGLPSTAAEPSPLQQPPPDTGRGASPQEPAHEREASMGYDPAIFQASTPGPVAKYVGPIIGGVVGAGALAGVIALSVMKKPNTSKASEAPPAMSARVADGGKPEAPAQTAAPRSTSLASPVRVGDTSIQVQSSAGFAAGDTIKVGSEYNMVAGSFQGRLLGQGNVMALDHPMNTDQLNGATVTIVHDVVRVPAPAPSPEAPTPRPAPVPSSIEGNADTTAAASKLSSGPQGSTVGAIVVVLICCCLLSVCLVALLYFLFGRRKKRVCQNRFWQKEERPRGYQPREEQHHLYRGVETMMDLPQTMDNCESQYMQVQVPPRTSAQGMGSVPTLQNVVPMQTMPPPPSMATSYASQPSTYSNGVAPGSYYQNASPLANTVTALPTTVFNMGGMPTTQLPPTIYS